VASTLPSSIPHGRTAQRLGWQFLPPHLRSEIEHRCGAPVTSAESMDSGFTPGFASVLTCADGSKHFVKAASTKAQKLFADSFREEARKLAALPASVPAPRLQWSIDDDWVVLGIEYVAGRQPTRPWRPGDLAACLDTLEEMARVLTPAPLALGRFADEFADWPALWDQLRTAPPSLPQLAERLDEAAALAAGFAEATAGETLVHTDVRDDNVIIDPHGVAHFCDWNWPVRGAAWLDAVFLLIGPRGDGLDVEAVIQERPLLRDVPADHIDRVLAMLVGYFLKFAGDPVPPTSAYLRDAQRWQGEVCWAWLCERRHWA
jgi:aminoglycoside phosphotransferase (APT) family kinase protein